MSAPAFNTDSPSSSDSSSDTGTPVQKREPAQIIGGLASALAACGLCGVGYLIYRDGISPFILAGLAASLVVLAIALLLFVYGFDLQWPDGAVAIAAFTSVGCAVASGIAASVLDNREKTKKAADNTQQQTAEQSQ